MELDESSYKREMLLSVDLLSESFSQGKENHSWHT